MARFLTHMEHTEEGAKLTLTEEQEKNCRVVYRRSEEDPEHFVFAGLWNPEAEYPDDHVIVPLRSTYKGVGDEYDEGTAFANIIDSRDDPCTEGSWIKVIRDHLPDGYDVEPCCAEKDTFYDINTDTVMPGRQCTPGENNIVGGHVIMETKTPSRVREESEVCLLPICRAHNTGPGHGGSYYMRLRRKM